MITAVYSGHSTLATSTATSVNVTVNKDSTTTNVKPDTELRQCRPSRDLHRGGHGQWARLGDAHRNGRLLRYNDQYRPDAGRRRDLVRHCHFFNDKPRGSHTIKLTYSGNTNFLARAREHSHHHDQPVDHRPRPLGRRGAVSLSGNASIKHRRRRLRRLQLIECPVGQRQRDDQGVGDRRARRRPEERQRRASAPPRPRGPQCWPTRWPRCRSRAPPA